MENEYFVLYPSCIVVRGVRRSTICDLEREEFHYIPNGMVEVIEAWRTETTSEILSEFNEIEKSIIHQYKNFLIEKDLGFFTGQPSLYPPMNLQFEFPTMISNAILDRNEFSNYDLFNAINKLNAINCNDLQLRFFSALGLDELDLILAHVHETDMKSVEIFYCYNQDKMSSLKTIINKWPKIKLFLLHSAPLTKVLFMNKDKFYTSNQGNFISTSEVISSEQHCGQISAAYFSINNDTFAESQNHNSCLNKKISVDATGRIKNCPTLNVDYGHIDDVSLERVIEDELFLSYGKINKDQIEVCRDCEHRHFCTDCRAFVSDKFAKPQKCSYDPYTAQWLTKV